MRIGLDVRPLTPRRAGIGRYVEGLLSGLATLDHDHEFRLFGHSGVDCVALPADPRFTFVELPPGPGFHLAAARRVRADRVEVYHSPSSFLVPLVHPSRSVVTVHDLAPLRFPETSALKTRATHLLLRRVLARAAGILTVSDAIRDELLALAIPGLADRLHVTPEAADVRFSPGSAGPAILARIGLETPYLLSVGTLEPRKNLVTLLAAYRQAPELPPLALVGAAGWKTSAFFATLGSDPDPRIRLLGRVSDDDLVALYRGATAFVYPSRYEGFGLPVLEAMACGTPVATTTDPALAELSGEAALTVPPTDAAALAAALTAVTTDADLRDQVSQAGLRRAAQFSWQRTAMETLAVYESFAGGS